MKLFEFDKNSYEVRFSEEAILLTPFKKIIARDKTKSKDLAVKELSFVWFYAELISPYQGIIDLKEREAEIIRDIELPKGWKQDKIIEEAVSFYKDRSRTIVSSLYDSALIAASAINDVFSNAKALIEESKDKIEATEKVIRALEKVPKVMANLKDAEKELIRQVEDKEGKKVGSKEFNIFEDGIKVD